MAGFKGWVAAVLAAGVAWAGAGAASAADGQGFALGVHGGTTGIGVDAQAGLGPHLALRGSLDGLVFGHDATYGGIPYTGRWHGVTGGVFADLHPFANAFMLSGGVYAGTRKATITSKPTGPISIGGHSFTPDQVGQLDGEVRLSSAAPFAGVGFSNAFRTKSRWSVTAVAGVAFSGRPKVTLASSGGTFSSNPAVLSAVAAEQEIIAHDVRNYRYYPVATIGIAYRF